MSFKSLNHLLRSLENQPGLQELQQFSILLSFWPTVVEPEIASQTRPVAISRGVLWVATKSATLAQDLTFSRHRILPQLNPHLLSPLVDIRFSTAKWHNDSRHRSDRVTLSEVSSPQHPSHVVETGTLPPVRQTPEFDDPKSAFQHWASVVRARSQHLPLCPQCQCHTPPGELDRWDVCALCATKQWQA